MSYDFYVEAHGTTIYDANYTSNCSGVWHRSFEGVGGKPEEHFADALERGTAAEAAKILSVMLDWIEQQPQGWAASFDAPNGWGNGADAVRILRELRDACLQVPDGRVRISR